MNPKREAELIPEVELLRHERDRAKAQAEDMLGRWGGLVSELQAYREVVGWLAELGQSWAVDERREVRLQDIIDRAQGALDMGRRVRS